MTEDAKLAAIEAAIVKADEDFSYSFRLTRLVDGDETHTLTMPGFDPVDFDDRDDGYRVIAERRAKLRASAILAAITPDPRLAQAEAALEEARAKMRGIISHATGGHWSDHADRSQNDICVEISRNRNMVYQAGKDAALSTPVQRQPSPAEVRAEALEEAAKVAEEVPLVGVLAPGWPDGAASASRQIVTSIRALKDQEAGRG